MVIMNGQGYLEVKRSPKEQKGKTEFLIKNQINRTHFIGYVYLGKTIFFPKEHIGKRIRLKVEFVDDVKK